MGFNQLIEISRRSFWSLNGAMNTVGHNVANANTPGYLRRRVTLASQGTYSQGVIIRNPMNTPVGGGVSIQSIDRVRDRLLSAAGWDAGAALGSTDEQYRVMSALEGLFPVDSGSLNDLLDGFWNAWSDLSDNPLDSGARSAVSGSASSLTSTLNRLGEDITSLEGETQAALDAGVEEVNSLLEEIAALNTTIQEAQLRGAPDLEAEDRRDSLVQELSAYAPVDVKEGAEGFTVSMNGMTVVEQGHVLGLEVSRTGGTTQVLFSGTGVAFQGKADEDGKIGAWLKMVGETLPEARAELDTFAATLVENINAVHATGYGTDGVTGRNFFDPAGLTAGTIRLSDDVLADVGAIAASGDPAAEGDNSVALAIAELRTAKLFNGGTETAETFVTNLVSGIGAESARVASLTAGNVAVMEYVEGMQLGVSGVSIDEEMTNMVRYQQAYAAAARVLNTAEEMMDVLLAL